MLSPEFLSYVAGAFILRYPTRYILRAGAAHWSGRPDKIGTNKYDIIINPDLSIVYTDKHPLAASNHIYLNSHANFSICLSAMAGVTSYIWDTHRFDTSYHPNMVSLQQYELLCALFAVASIHLYIPVESIRTHEEYAKMSYPKYPNGYYPKHWDLDGLGPDMRNRINNYARILEKIIEVAV